MDVYGLRVTATQQSRGRILCTALKMGCWLKCFPFKSIGVRGHQFGMMETPAGEKIFISKREGLKGVVLLSR